MSSGDKGHVHHQRSVLIMGEHGQSYVVPRVVKRSTVQELFSVPRVEKRDICMDCAPGSIQIMVCIFVLGPNLAIVLKPPIEPQ
jgi:hypothetical protein